MNEAFYENMSNLAVKLLNDFGKEGKLIRHTKTYDKATAKTVTTTEEVPCLLVFASRNQRTSDGLIHTDTICTMNVEPKIGDEIVGGYQPEYVAAVEVVSPVGVPIVWRAVLK